MNKPKPLNIPQDHVVNQINKILSDRIYSHLSSQLHNYLWVKYLNAQLSATQNKKPVFNQIEIDLKQQSVVL